MTELRFQSVVFDLDGTITRSGEGIVNSVKYALSELGQPIPEDAVLAGFVGPELRDSFMGITHLDQAQSEEAVRLFRKRHEAIGWREAKVYPGIFEMICALKRHGAYVALASSKSLMLCERTLEYFGLRGLFDKITAPVPGGERLSKAELICRCLPETPGKSCMIGDRKFDMIGAKEAGVYALGVLYGYGSRQELEQSGADELCQDVPALRRALLDDAPREKGRFISFEGSDGCGKSTQLKLARQYLEDCGIEVVSTREPGGCPISERIRALLLDTGSMGMTDECEALLFAAARAQHINDTIKPALEKGAVVLCDRFVDSSIAYQGAGRGLGDWVRQINQRAVEKCLPDLTLVFDISPEEAIRRRYSASQADRIELSTGDFHRRVYEAFLSLCDTDQRFYKVDASGSIEQIGETVRQRLVKLLTEYAEDDK